MPIVGYNFKKIEAEKEKNIDPKQRLDISSTPEIESVEESTLDLFGKQPSLAVDFEFKTEYKPNIGKIKIEGELIYATPNAKKIAKDWEKDKKLPPEIDIEIKNFLFRKCLKFGLLVSEELQLPPPIAFPVIIPKEKVDEEKDNKTKYIG